ncbi:MAG: DNA polymerase I [Acidobacteria bacterium]|nr:DNA polymerase I [Acidobacteriota bacterium]
MKKIFLVDASSILFRAFYAIRNLSTAEGKKTNAIFGTVKMAEKILKEHSPQYLAFVFDLPEPTFRHQEYAEYKANREETPKDLQEQIEPSKEILRNMGIPIVELKGYEADDVIATIAENAKNLGFEVIIVTADKDLFQLVDEKVKIIHTKKEDALLDREGVKEVFGVYPENVTDVLALWGDPVDNIKGVPGIGEKGAKELVAKFGTLENIIANIDKIEKKSYRESLKENIESALLSKKLSTIQKGAPVEIEIEQLKLRERNEAELRKLFEKYQFFSMIKEEVPPEPAFLLKPFNEEIFALLSKKEHIGFSLSQDKIFLSDGQDVFFLEKKSDFVRKVFTLPLSLLDSKEVIKEFDIEENETSNWNDLSIACYLLDPENTKNLEMAIKRHLHFSIGREPSTLAFQYQLLTPFILKDLDSMGMTNLYREIELPLSSILAKMEKRGILVDKNYFEKLSKEFDQKIREVENKIFDIVGVKFNLASPKQVSEILFSKLRLPSTRKTAKTKSFSTETDALEDIYEVHPIIPLILEHRTLNKLKTTYIDALPNFIDEKTSKVHTTFNQTATATGRLSSKDPNLQNIPVKGEYGFLIRRGFVSSEGMAFVSADYSQIELRILAHLSKDEVLKRAFKENIDIHTLLASQIFGVSEKDVSEDMRRKAKAVNYSIIYGKGVFGLSRDLRITRAESSQFLEKFFKTFPSVYDYLEKVKKEAVENEEVKTILGRRRFFPGIKKAGKQVQESLLRQAVNAVIQGSAADLIKKAMIEVDKNLPEGSQIVLQIHDELIVESEEKKVEQTKAVLKNFMENAISLDVPVTVAVSSGKRWDEL